MSILLKSNTKIRQFVTKNSNKKNKLFAIRNNGAVTIYDEKTFKETNKP